MGLGSIKEEQSCRSEAGTGISYEHSAFEFPKSGKPVNNVPINSQQRCSGRSTGAAPPLSKAASPAPSKWDDAQKWLINPFPSTSSDLHTSKSKANPIPNPNPKQIQSKSKSKAKAKALSAVIAAASSAPPPPALEEDEEKDLLITQEEEEEVSIDTKKIDYVKSSENNKKDTEKKEMGSNRNEGVGIRSVSMRDAGTDMTPITSQEPSRTATPIRATTPCSRSPVNSRPSTPARSSSVVVSLNMNQPKEAQQEVLNDGNNSTGNTRREIMVLSSQLGKSSIAAWASKEEEDQDASKSLNMHSTSRKLSALEARAAAWEQAEKAKYTARFKREEIKIQAWESQQRRKAESEMKKIEEKIEIMKCRAQEKLANKLEKARRGAEERRAAAEAKMEKHATKTSEKAEFMRKRGHLPSSFSFSLPSCFSGCCW